MDFARFGPLVRRRIRHFYAFDERPDELLLEFFKRTPPQDSATCDSVWALATRYCMKNLREGRRSALLVAPSPGSWAEQANASSTPGYQQLTRSWRDLTPQMLELLIYAEVDGMSAGQIAELINEPRSWVVDQLHARAKQVRA